jgi:acetyltransferase-like isoleucine patch superfamily enzyme
MLNNIYIISSLRWIILLFRIRLLRRNNDIRISKPKQLSNFNISIKGCNNTILIEDKTVLTNTKIEISGENNRLVIHKNARFYGPCRIIMQGNSLVEIGENAGIRGVDFLSKDGAIQVGELCMFSYGIVIRTHDSHKIISLESNSITNNPKDVVLGKHVWVAQNVTILKGVTIGDNSVLGFGSIVTKDCGSNSVMTGIPAKVVRTGITWDY